MVDISYNEFVRLVRRAYLRLPSQVLDALENVDVTVEEWPGPNEEELLEEGGTLFGLYYGVPLTDREGGSPVLPDRITLYRQPILDNCESRSDVLREIRITLWHEVGHFLGMDEDDLHRLGYG
ncbi:MAG: metallopeptidase family protein [Chloroflexi bacterium]|nr:metallopeptidase family protein [Chloroflexota bacterium]